MNHEYHYKRQYIARTTGACISEEAKIPKLSSKKNKIIAAIKAGKSYREIQDSGLCCQMTITRYKKAFGLFTPPSQKPKPAPVTVEPEKRRFKGERILSHYNFSKPTAKDSFVCEMF